MNINPGIFRAYDIRGTYPIEINEEVSFYIGKAFVEFLKKNKRDKKLNIVVGRDNRLSSPTLFKGLVKGILDSGANVINIGLSTTPMLYFSVAHYKFNAGIQITASHNPAQYNGFKLVKEESLPIGGDNGLKEIRTLVKKFQKQNLYRKIMKVGRISKKEITSAYIEFNLKDFKFNKGKTLSLVIDTANGISGIITPKVLKKTRLKTYYLFSKLDGNFPNHPPDPITENNLRSLKREVIKRKTALGIAFDGDGDRIVFVDEKGEVIFPDLIFALVSDEILKSKPRAKILYTISSSNIVKETIKKGNGIPVLSRVGHTFIKERMRKENIIFAGESSGHYSLRVHYFSEAPFFILFKVIEIILKSGKKISELVKPYQKYFYSGEINFRIKESDFQQRKKKILHQLEKKYKKGEILKLDGLRIDFSDWWFLLRPSNTEPLLRLIVEAKSKELMGERKKELRKLILD